MRVHNTVNNCHTQYSNNSSDNLPSYPPDNHHCSDIVYRREVKALTEKLTNSHSRNSYLRDMFNGQWAVAFEFQQVCDTYQKMLIMPQYSEWHGKPRQQQPFNILHLHYLWQQWHKCAIIGGTIATLSTFWNVGIGSALSNCRKQKPPNEDF